MENEESTVVEKSLFKNTLTKISKFSANGKFCAIT